MSNPLRELINEIDDLKQALRAYRDEEGAMHHNASGMSCSVTERNFDVFDERCPHCREVDLLLERLS